jgi:endoglucanase
LAVKIRAFWVPAIVLGLLAASCGPSGEFAWKRETPAPPYVRRAPPPQLLILGGQIRNTYGEQVVLRGVAIDEPSILARNPTSRGHFSAEDYRVLADSWDVNIIRVPIYPTSWAREPEYMESYLDPLVGWGGEYGLYIFLGWHAHGNPVTGQEEVAAFSPDLEMAESALGAMAERYRDKPWVLYGTFNEPAFLSWSEWKPVAERLVDIVQNVHPAAVVFVSGIDFGYDLTGAIKDPIGRANIIYETHPYPGKGESWKGVLDQIRTTTPVFLGEWGFNPNAKDRNLRGSREKYGLPLLQYARDRNIGWTAWQWRTDYPELGMLESWEGYEPTDWGLFAKEALSQQ